MAKKEDDNIVNLYGTSTTTHGNSTTVTERDPKHTTRVEQTYNGYTNPDGTPNEAAYRELEEGTKRLASAYHVNPETGRVEPKYLSDVIGFDPDVTRKRREAEEALNRRKAKESAWVQGLGVLLDSGVTAIGGNVWKRQPMQHGKEAHAANLALQREQQAEEAAIGKAKQATEQAYAKAVQDLYDKVGKAYSTKVSKSQEDGGKTTSTTERGDDVTKSQRQALKYRGYGYGGRGGGSGSRSSNKVVKIRLKDGRTVDVSIPAGQYDASGRYLSALYNSLDAAGEDNIAKVLSESGIEPQETGKDKYTYDGADLLASGIVFDNEQIREEFKKAVNSDDSLSDEEKAQIIRDMQTYPTTAPKEHKESWFKRKWNEWFGDKEDGNDAPWLNKGNSNDAPWLQGK